MKERKTSLRLCRKIVKNTKLSQTLRDFKMRLNNFKKPVSSNLQDFRTTCLIILKLYTR